MNWAPPEGIYGGWGNFGSAAAAMVLPSLALLFGGDDGWRYAIGLTGAMSLLFSVIWYKGVSDTPRVRPTSSQEERRPRGHQQGRLRVPAADEAADVCRAGAAHLEALARRREDDFVGRGDGYLPGPDRHLFLRLLRRLPGQPRDLRQKPVPEMHRYKFKR